MADQERRYDEDYDLLHNKQIDENQYEVSSDYSEETAAEIAPPVSYDDDRGREGVRENQGEGRGIGITALVLSIISLFVMPIILGAAGIILGFIANRRGATGFGSWAIGIGAISIIVGLFILPFF
ncbi:hypothetical protein J2S17_001337 [Cytobacillus purgationiresistens]|uniref:DUF308 domain-containing protein n=2 Tax=Cytobacillus purgationiresistens TaxID=863449 RepID=A0ABU0AFH5_9BACI|nr:hypothetical protein [Cytobacillus purgationiresistens]